MNEVGIVCSACSHIYRWCDERLPNFCPECGVQTQSLNRRADPDYGTRMVHKKHYTIIDESEIEKVKDE